MILMPARIEEIEALASDATTIEVPSKYILALCASAKKGLALDGLGEDKESSATFWLVEMVHNDAPVPRYWHCVDGFVWDALKATRFNREQDVHDFLKGQRFLQGKPSEHSIIEERSATR